MQNLAFVIQLVDDPSRSARFYAARLGLSPVEQSPTFAAFALPGGLMLGLWSARHATPAVAAKAGGSEIAFAVEDVDAVYRAWRGVRPAPGSGRVDTATPSPM